MRSTTDLIATLACMTVLAYSALTSAKTSPSSECNLEKVTASIQAQKVTHQADDIVRVQVQVTNGSGCDVYVLESPTVMWSDSSNATLWVAHHAFTPERELELSGSATRFHSVPAEFRKISAGAETYLDAAFAGWHKPGPWRVKGKVSVIQDIGELRGLEGDALTNRMAEIDVVIDCLSTQVMIRP